jgi:hypothetical protein
VIRVRQHWRGVKTLYRKERIEHKGIFFVTFAFFAVKKVLSSSVIGFW